MGACRLELPSGMQPGGEDKTGAESTVAEPAARRSWVPVTVLAVIATFVITLVLMRMLGHEAKPETLRVSVLGPEGTVLSQEVPDIAISPDGRMLAFVAQDSAGTGHLWLRSLASNTC